MSSNGDEFLFSKGHGAYSETGSTETLLSPVYGELEAWLQFHGSGSIFSPDRVIGGLHD